MNACFLRNKISIPDVRAEEKVKYVFNPDFFIYLFIYLFEIRRRGVFWGFFFFVFCFVLFCFVLFFSNFFVGKWLSGSNLSKYPYLTVFDIFCMPKNTVFKWKFSREDIFREFGSEGHFASFYFRDYPELQSCINVNE